MSDENPKKLQQKVDTIADSAQEPRATPNKRALWLGRIEQGTIVALLMGAIGLVSWLSNLNTNVEGLSDDVNGIKTSITTINDSLTKLSNSIEGNSTSVKGLHKDVGRLESAQSLKDQKAELESTIDSTRTQLLAFQSEMMKSGLPAGSIIAWPGANAPEGWAVCDGTDIKLDPPVYVEVRKVLIAFGVGQDGTAADTVRLPDLRGFFLRGFDSSPDSHTGKLGQIQNGLISEHSHNATSSDSDVHSHEGTAQSAGQHSHNASSGNAGGHSHRLSEDVAHYDTGGDTDGDPNGARNRGKPETDRAPDHSHSVSVNEGGQHSHTLDIAESGVHKHDVTVAASGGVETRPINRAVNWIIKLVEPSSV